MRTNTVILMALVVTSAALFALPVIGGAQALIQSSTNTCVNNVCTNTHTGNCQVTGQGTNHIRAVCRN